MTPKQSRGLNSLSVTGRLTSLERATLRYSSRARIKPRSQMELNNFAAPSSYKDLRWHAFHGSKKRPNRTRNSIAARWPPSFLTCRHVDLPQHRRLCLPHLPACASSVDQMLKAGPDGRRWNAYL